MTKFSDVEVRITGNGTDGNVFSIIGTVSKALKNAGYKEEAKAFTQEAFSQKSYDDVLSLVCDTVNVV
jgi:hypothetical protein